jgi:hypothetical protein
VNAGGLTCSSATCAPKWAQCGGWRYVDSQDMTPPRKLDIRQCCDATQECVQYRSNYFQCRPKVREPLTGWADGTGAVVSCGSQLPLTAFSRMLSTLTRRCKAQKWFSEKVASCDLTSLEMSAGICHHPYLISCFASSCPKFNFILTN